MSIALIRGKELIDAITSVQKTTRQTTTNYGKTS